MQRNRVIVLTLVIIIGLVAWAGAANAAVDQKGVLTGKVLAEGLVTPGASVREGDVLVYVSTITGSAPAVRATCDGQVVELLVKPGDSVRTGDVLVRIEPARKK
jgi:biotin carboxyl carrier protein